MHEMCYMKIKTVLIATVVTFAVILMGSINGNAFGSTQQGNNLYSLIAIWGTEGTGDGEFQKPHSIAVDSSNYIYVTDEDNKNVQKYTSDGKFVTQWGFEAAGGETGEPHGIEIDSSGNVYVAIRDNSKILKYTSDG